MAPFSPETAVLVRRRLRRLERTLPTSVKQLDKAVRVARRAARHFGDLLREEPLDAKSTDLVRRASRQAEGLFHRARLEAWRRRWARKCERTSRGPLPARSSP
jgi:hypothetical protein